MGNDNSKPSTGAKVGQGFLAAGTWVLAVVTAGGFTHLALTQTEATIQMVNKDKDWITAQKEGFLLVGDIMDSADAIHGGLDNPSFYNN